MLRCSSLAYGVVRPGPNAENTLRFYAYPSLGAVSSGLAPIKGVQGIADDADESAEQNTELALASICLLKRKKLVLVMVERHGWGTVKVRRETHTGNSDRARCVHCSPL